MDKLQLHYGKFCSLARQAEFRSWLKTTAPDLEDYLAQTSPVGGCKARAERMVHVYNKLYDTGKGPIFENLIKSRFPYVIDASTKPADDPRKLMVARPPLPNAPVRVTRVENTDALNTHGVFKIYKPEILTFPQKRIIVNSDPNQLKAQVDYFIKDKYGVDTLIIEDRAYIEFFDTRYKDVAEKLPKEKRDIYQFKQKVKNAASASS